MERCMRKKNVSVSAYVALIASFLMPAVAFATTYTSGGYISVTNDSQVSNVTSATADTGGNSAGSGQNVRSGPSSASASVSNSLNDGQGGGSVHVDIETSANGEVRKESYDKVLQPGESVAVATSTSVGNMGGEARVTVKSKIKVSSHATGTAAASTSTTLAGAASSTVFSGSLDKIDKSLYKSIFSRLPSAWHGFVSLLWLW